MFLTDLSWFLMRFPTEESMGLLSLESTVSIASALDVNGA